VVRTRQKRDFLATKKVTGVLELLFSFVFSESGKVLHKDLRTGIDECRLKMGSIEVEESIVALAILESLSDKLLMQEPLRSRLPGIEVRKF